MQVHPVPPLTADYATAFTMTKAGVLTTADDRTTVTQFGAAYVEAPEPMGGWPAATLTDDATIESFLVEPTGEIVPLGVNDTFNAEWLPLVRALADTVRAALDAFGISLDGPGYVTASTTPSASLEGLAHLDDDQFVADDGVGVVAICGEYEGPRIAVGELDFAPIAATAGQLTVTDERVSAFAAGQVSHQQAEANRIVVFPQFGQLHAGPTFAGAAPGDCRGLLVFRAQTASAARR